MNFWYLVKNIYQYFDTIASHANFNCFVTTLLVQLTRHKISLSEVATTAISSRTKTRNFEVVCIFFFRWILFVRWFQIHGHLHVDAPSILGSRSIVFVFSRYHGQ